ncbi:MAG TPA: VOC family protein [bacterium]|jgi:catechol 2,3-dioxygenase-like lactoylglutathione lyase family enzyme
MENDQPEVAISWVNIAVNDVSEMRHFYTDLIGLEEMAFADTDEFGMLGYNCGGFHIAFIKAFREIPVATEFAHIPSIGAPPYNGTSFSIVLTKDRFDEVVGRLADEGYQFQTDGPVQEFHGMMLHRVMDPMGYTVDLAYSPEE